MDGICGLQKKNSWCIVTTFQTPDDNDIYVQVSLELLFFLMVLEAQFLPKNQIQIKFKIGNYPSISRNFLPKHYTMKIQYQSAQFVCLPFLYCQKGAKQGWKVRNLTP